MTFDFALSDELQDFTRADLLLYQVPVTQNQYNSEQRQYVEIKAQYESVSLSSTTSGKTIDAYESGFQAFDIATAVNTWVTQGTKGNVTLKVSIQCYSSPSCSKPTNGQTPEAITFKDFDSSEHAPRIIVTSRNPLEARSDRNKRQVTSVKSTKCKVNQSICCLKPLNISFAEDLGLDFIVEPTNFEANYCEGMCPIYNSGDLMTPQLYQFLSRLQGSPVSNSEPCCAGNTFDNLQIVIANRKGFFIIEELKQMKVTSCRCA